MDQNSGAAVADNTVNPVASADFNVNIQDQLGVPPAPPIPDFLTSEPTMPGVNPSVMADLTNSAPTPITATMPEPTASAPEQPVATPEPVIPGDAGSTEEVVSEAGGMMANMTAEGTGGGNLEEIKKQMLQDLYPLMDKIKMQPEQKFKVYKQMIETTGSKEMIASAYEAVKGIDSEETRAEALLFLVEKADN